MVEEEKLQLAFISMEGYAGSWSNSGEEREGRFMRGCRPLNKWAGGRVYLRIRSTGGANNRDPEEQIMGYFTTGLQEQIMFDQRIRR